MKQRTCETLTLFFIIIVFSFIHGSVYAHGPSFPCSKASTREEKLVCSDENLSFLDDLLNRQYQRVSGILRNEEREKLRRDQREWMKLRAQTIETISDEQKAIEELKNLYAKRISTLFKIDLKANKHFISRFPTDDCEAVRKLCEDNKLPPKGCIRISEDRYLVLVSDIGRLSQGFYLADVSGHSMKHIKRGYPDMKGAYRRGDTFWMLAKSSDLHRGISDVGYSAYILTHDENGEMELKSYGLATCRYDGESGLCGGSPERAMGIGLSEASEIWSFDIMDINNDGMEDIIFLVQEMDCINHTISFSTQAYTYTRDGFKEQENEEPQPVVERKEEEPAKDIAELEITLPDWVVDTISLPLNGNPDKNIVHSFIYQDNNNEYLINYFYRINSKHEDRWFNIHTHQEILAPPTTDKRSVDMENAEQLVSSKPIELLNTHYKVSCRYQYFNCDTPFNYWLEFWRDGNCVGRYMLVFSSPQKFFFQTGEDCWDMGGKSSIMISNLFLYPELFYLGNNRLLAGSREKPYFIIIDMQKLDQALNETKAQIFSDGGVKGYWVERELIEKWINEAIEDLKGKKRKKGKSVNEYVDDYITIRLNEYL